VGHFGWHTFRHTYATLLKGNGEDVKVVQELMRHANVSVTLNVYAQAITQTKRDAQSRVVSLLLDKNEEKPSTEAYRTVTDLQNSGGDLQVVDQVGVPLGTILNQIARARTVILKLGCTLYAPEPSS
jgi:integrase-like protein